MRGFLVSVGLFSALMTTMRMDWSFCLRQYREFGMEALFVFLMVWGSVSLLVLRKDS